MDEHRAERPTKRQRRLSTDDESDSGTEDGKVESATAVASRPRRGVTARVPATTIQRSSPDEGSYSSIRLTVKSDPKKLKEATSGTSSKKNVSLNSRDAFDGQIVNGPRQTRKKAIVEESSSEDEDEDEDEAEPGENELVANEEEEEEEDDADSDDDDAQVDDDDEGEEQDGMDDEGEDDEAVTDAPLPPLQFATKPASDRSRLAISGPTLTEDDDDDELSSLDDEDVEGELEEQIDEGDIDVDVDMDANEDDDEDEDEDENENENENEDGNGDEGSDEEVSGNGTRDGTPDMSKLTRRQRAAFEELEGGGLMALSNEAQKKKHLTAEEHAMRRAEMARRRKNLSEKRNEEEKMDTINRLLKKQAPKRRGRAQIEADRMAEGLEDDFDGPKASAVYVRYIHNVRGSKLAIPEEWLSAPFNMFSSMSTSTVFETSKMEQMIEEVDQTS